MDEVDFYLMELEWRFQHIDPKQYYLSYSGGKDSHFLYWFIKEYLHDDQIKIISCNTYMEHPEILQRMLKNSDEVLVPTLTPKQIKERFGIPCFTKSQDEFIERYQNGNRSSNTMQYITRKEKSKFNLNKKASLLVQNDKLHKVSNKCCKYLKKQPFIKYEKRVGRKAILGVRSSESVLRQSQYTGCFTKDKKFTPLHDLNNELLEAIYKKYEIEVPEVYRFISRTGCMGCPYGSRKGSTEIELKLLNDRQRSFVINYMRESYKVLGIKLDFQKSIYDFIEEGE